jgi:hypothetical protein
MNATTGGPLYTDGDLLTFRKVGSQLSVMRNGTLELYVDDPSPLTTPGYVGFGSYNGTQFTQDNFSARTISSGTVTSIATIDGLANAQVQTVNALARASVQTWAGVA